MSLLAVDEGAGAEVSASDFGQVLQIARRRAGMTQKGLVDRLGQRIARSTLANIETGRERPSQRVYAMLVETFPEWEDHLAPAFARSRMLTGVEATRRRHSRRPSRQPAGHALGGPYQIEQLQIVYVFRHSRAPEEIIETRRIRAVAGGGDGFGLKFSAQSEHFEADDEILWGGRLESSLRFDREGHTTYLQRIDFGKSLRRGDVHEFAVRRWVARDPHPDTEALFSLTLPADQVSLHVKFLGPQRPRRILRVGPLADYCLVRDGGALEAASAVDTSMDVSEYFVTPTVGCLYGIIWDW